MQKTLVSLFYTNRADQLVEVYEMQVRGSDSLCYTRYEVVVLTNFEHRRLISNSSATVENEKNCFKTFEEARREADKQFKGSLKRIEDPNDLGNIELGARWEKGVMKVHLYPSRQGFPTTVRAKNVVNGSHIAGKATKALFRYIYGPSVVNMSNRLCRKK